MGRGATISTVWLLVAWVGLNLLTAAFAPLDADETYYWMYARYLDWGYYDHPPAVAVLIKLGKDWLPGSLGLRFGHVLASALTLWGFWELLERPGGKHLRLAAALVAAQPFLNVYGFIATPDGPLLLFTVWYLVAYRRFLAAPSLGTGAVWGVLMAGLLWSKYHGLMVIFFTVLPHAWWLIRQPGAWVAVLGGAALYLPHLYWQYAHDFPSFRYHLQGRNDPYQLKYTLSYVGNQLLIFSPLLLWYYLRTFISDDGRGNRFVIANRWLVLGFLCFFLYMTSKGSTEAQWTAVLSFPLVYLLYVAIRDRFPEWGRSARLLGWVTFGILLVARLLLMAPRDLLPFTKPFDHQPWTERLAERAGDLPIMVENSYRLASLYQFYTGRPSWTMTNVEYRRNQYDLWVGDSVFHNQPVLVMGQRDWKTTGAAPFRVFDGDMKLKRVDNFQVLKSGKLTLSGLPNALAIGREYAATVDFGLPAGSGIGSVDVSAGLPATLFLTVHYPENGEKYYFPIAPAGKVNGAVRFTIPDHFPAGDARLELGLAYAGMPPLRGQSELMDVTLQ